MQFPLILQLGGNINAIKGGKTGALAASRIAGPNLRPRAVLGDLTKITAASSNQVPSRQMVEKKPVASALPKPKGKPNDNFFNTAGDLVIKLTSILIAQFN